MVPEVCLYQCVNMNASNKPTPCTTNNWEPKWFVNESLTSVYEVIALALAGDVLPFLYLLPSLSFLPAVHCAQHGSYEALKGATPPQGVDYYDTRGFAA